MYRHPTKTGTYIVVAGDSHAWDAYDGEPDEAFDPDLFWLDGDDVSLPHLRRTIREIG